MCACEGSFVCSRCKGTPFDPHYLLDEPDELTAAEFDWLTVQDGRSMSYALWGQES